jgi:Leucine-rich repeat (LRR) protein
MNAVSASPEREIYGKGRIHFVAALLTMALISIAIVANLPFKYVEVNGGWHGVAQTEEMSRTITDDEMPIIAGWPLQYSIQYQGVEQLEQRLWSSLRLTGNILIFVLVIVAVYGYVWFRGNYIAKGQNQRRSQLLDVGTALAIILVPATISGIEYYGAWQHRRIANQLGRYGNCFLAVWIPEVLVTRIPPGLQQALLRIRSVDLTSADSSTIALACKTPGVATISCLTCEVTADHLEGLVDNHHFRGLQISRQDLDSSLINAIANLGNLTQLDLSRTNLDSDQLAKLDHLRLRHINFTNTNLGLSEIGKPSWSQTVEELSLSRPKKGLTDSLEVDGWPQLRSLRVYRATAVSNPSILKVRLANLPALSIVGLDRNQQHDLELTNLPLLSSFDEGLGFLQTILASDAKIPGNMWLARFKAVNTPSLKKFGCYAHNLDQLSLESMTALRTLELGSYQVSIMNGIYVEDAPLLNTEDWIIQLGQRVGPSTLNLMGLPLQNTDLSPLKNNPGIRRLNLMESGITFKQVQQLAGMRQLESLNIRDCEVEQDSLAWILDKFPNLDELVINGDSLATVDVSEHEHLRKLRISKLARPQRVSLVDVPLLKTELHLERCPQQLEICNAKSMTGLSVNAPWPEHGKLQGMRDLDWFAVGGSHVTDALLDEVLVCKDLDQLTLAYTSVSTSRLKQIGELKTLSTLSVPGSELKPSVIAAWTQLKSLWDVNLDDTKISTGTLVWLSKIPSLRRLSLNRTHLDDQAAEKLGELTQLSELQLAEVEVNKNRIRPLLQANNIESLNLSGWNIDDDFMQWLLKTKSLRMLTLHECQITPRQLERFMERVPAIALDLGPQVAKLDRETQRELENRLTRLTLGTIEGWKTAIRKRLPTRQGNAQVTYRESDRIEIENFR